MDENRCARSTRSLGACYIQGISPLEIMKKSSVVSICVIAFLVLLTIPGCRLSRGTLNVEAQIIYNMGGPQPVARQNFYLLDVDPFTLDGNDPKHLEKFNASKSESEKQVLSLATVMFLLLKDSIEKKQFPENSEKKLLSMVEMSKPFWEAHMVSSLQTDFSGKGKFENITAVLL
jgi:hypothetical protein